MSEPVAPTAPDSPGLKVVAKFKPNARFTDFGSQQYWKNSEHLRWAGYVADSIAWVVALGVASLIRYDGMEVAVPWHRVGWLMVAAIILQLVAGTLTRVYLGRHTLGSFESLFDLVNTGIMVAIVLWFWTLLFPHVAGVPRSLVVIAAPFAILLMAGAQYLYRFMRDRGAKTRTACSPVLLYGAGYVGDTMTRLLTTDSTSTMIPVGLLDDDPAKKRLRMHGISVLGTLDDLDRVVEKTGAQQIIVSIGDPSRDLLQRVQDHAQAAGVRVLVTPSTQEMFREGISSADLRDLDIEDLLGREQVDTDVSAIAGYLNGKRVLVTGAGGSIGQQLCVEIQKHGPAELMLLDRDETGLQDTDIRIKGDGLLDTNEVILADIRDGNQLKRIFKERKPDVVFHAAALKHLPMLEQYPDEAWKTNVLGTLNVLEAAIDCGTETLINISTDKAANPTSILGISKRIAERLTSGAGECHELRYLSVRFGNVIGSRGSMLPTFRKLIESDQPLTVTHPDITRYFMTIPEACQLVLQAGAIGRIGEVLILDMGEPVRILDIAQKMVDLSGKQVPIRFTGLREGEKLHEDLHNTFEVEESPFHPKISHAKVQALSPDALAKTKWNILVQAGPSDRANLVYRAHMGENMIVPETIEQ